MAIENSPSALASGGESNDEPPIVARKGPARFLLPLAVFLIVAGFLFVGLGLRPREVPSVLIGKPAPLFDLPQLAQPEQSFSPKQMEGQVWLLNVWASWCAPCRQEHPLLLELARTKTLPIVGLNYKDKPEAAQGWLAQLGDPYALSARDLDGRVAIDYGVYGVPETFIIDRGGVIRYKHIGPLTDEIWNRKMLPLVQQLRQ